MVLVVGLGITKVFKVFCFDKGVVVDLVYVDLSGTA